MARREHRVTVTDPGRDHGKVFLIREMAADQGERWANRFILLLLEANVRTPKDINGDGMLALALSTPANVLGSIKWLAGVAYNHELEELLDAQMACVQYVPPGGNFPPQDLASGTVSQIEEISTRWLLRSEWLGLHLGFLLAGDELTSETSPPQSPA